MHLLETNLARIMIADDSELVRSTLKEMLEIGKHQVISEAVDGVDTLEKFNSTSIIFLDNYHRCEK